MNIQKINNVAFNGRIIVTGRKNGSNEAKKQIIPSHEITAIVHAKDYKTSTIHWKQNFLHKEDYIEVDNTNYSSSCPADGHNAIINAYTAATSADNAGCVDIYV